MFSATCAMLVRRTAAQGRFVASARCIAMLGSRCARRTRARDCSSSARGLARSLAARPISLRTMPQRSGSGGHLPLAGINRSRSAVGRVVPHRILGRCAAGQRRSSSDAQWRAPIALALDAHAMFAQWPAARRASGVSTLSQPAISDPARLPEYRLAQIGGLGNMFQRWLAGSWLSAPKLSSCVLSPDFDLV